MGSKPTSSIEGGIKMMQDLRGEEMPCQKDSLKAPEKMNGFEASIDIYGGFACQCPKCKKERGC